MSEDGRVPNVSKNRVEEAHLDGLTIREEGHVQSDINSKHSVLNNAKRVQIHRAEVARATVPLGQRRDVHNREVQIARGREAIWL